MVSLSITKLKRQYIRQLQLLIDQKCTITQCRENTQLLRLEAQIIKLQKDAKKNRNFWKSALPSAQQLYLLDVLGWQIPLELLENWITVTQQLTAIHKLLKKYGPQLDIKEERLCFFANLAANLVDTNSRMYKQIIQNFTYLFPSLIKNPKTNFLKLIASSPRHNDLFEEFNSWMKLNATSVEIHHILGPLLTQRLAAHQIDPEQELSKLFNTGVGWFNLDGRTLISHAFHHAEAFLQHPSALSPKYLQWLKEAKEELTSQIAQAEAEHQEQLDPDEHPAWHNYQIWADAKQHELDEKVKALAYKHGWVRVNISHGYIYAETDTRTMPKARKLLEKLEKIASVFNENIPLKTNYVTQSTDKLLQQIEEELPPTQTGTA